MAILVLSRNDDTVGDILAPLGPPLLPWDEPLYWWNPKEKDKNYEQAYLKKHLYDKGKFSDTAKGHTLCFIYKISWK